MSKGPAVEERSLLLTGIVVEETKTKLGFEFYSDFYSIYNQFPKKHNFVITISELPHRGLTSIIQIKAGNDTVYEFFSNPNEDYMTQQIRRSMQLLARYAANRGNLKYEF